MNRTYCRLLPWGSVAAVALAAAVVGFWQPPNESAAAPHTLRRDVEHPFDADWPDVYMILAAKCAGCHRAGGDECDLSSYEAILAARTADDRPVVTPGDPENSPLWQQVAWNHLGVPGVDLPEEPAMPPDKAEWLTGEQMNHLHRWIRNGALEYKLPETCEPRPLLEFDFPSAKECKACHPRQYEQWSRSMHHYAQHSPVFEAFTLTLQEKTSGTMGTFCTRCHTPLGVALGETGNQRNIHRSRLSMEGVTCVVCHRMERPYYKASTRRAIVPGKMLEACMYGPFKDPATDGQTTHPSAGSAHLKSAAFCGACHDVTIPAGVRLEEAFSEWQNSPAAKQGITCQHCHMGPIMGVPIADHERPLGRAAEIPGVDPSLLPLRQLSDHTFAGPDYSLLPDTEFPEKLDWMYEIDYRGVEQLPKYYQETLTELRLHNRRQLEIARHKRYELLRNSARISLHAPETARCGSRVKVTAAVKSIFAGHGLPTGFTAERQVWVELTVYDPAGRIIFRSGDLDDNGDLRDDHSHAVVEGKLPYDKHLLNFQSKFVALTNRGTERTVVVSVNRHLDPLSLLRPADIVAASFGRPATFRVAKSNLPPLQTATRDYPIAIPSLPGEYRVVSKLNYRHLPPVLFDKVGVPHLKHLLEVVVIDEAETAITVCP